MPLVALGFAWPTHGASLLLAVGYVVTAWRVWRHGRRSGLAQREAVLYAAFCVSR